MALILILISYFMSSFIKLSANIVIPYFQASMNFSSSLAGLLSSMFFLPYAVMQFISGPISKKLNPLKTIGLGLIFAIFACLGFAFAKHPVTVVLSRLMFGLGVGPIYVSLIYYLSSKYDQQSYALYSSIAMGFSGLGSMSSAYPLKYMLGKFGITKSYIIIAIFISILSLLLLLLSRNEKQVIEDKNENLITQLKTAVNVNFNSKILLLGLCIWTLFTSIQMSYTGLWCTKWSEYSFTNHIQSASLFGTITNLGCVIGSFSAEKVHNIKNNRKQSSANSFIMFTISLLFMIFCKSFNLFYLSFVSDFFFGFCASLCCVQLLALIKESTENAVVNASTLGLWNAVASIGTLAFQSISGVMIDKLNSYSLTFLIFSFVMLIFCFLAAKIWKRQ